MAAKSKSLTRRGKSRRRIIGGSKSTIKLKVRVEAVSPLEQSA